MHFQFLILRSAERASRRMKARLVASPFETRADGALLRVRVERLLMTNHHMLSRPARPAMPTK
jgi:hypothetical protein